MATIKELMTQLEDEALLAEVRKQLEEGISPSEIVSQCQEGMSEVNQLNRIKLMLAGANKTMYKVEAEQKEKRRRIHSIKKASFDINIKG